MKKLNWRRPLFLADTGEEVHLIHRFPNGNLVIGTLQERAGTVDAYGRDVTKHQRTRVVNKVKVEDKVEYLSLYPSGNVYSRSDGPVRTSSYGVENLIQIKVTRRGDKIIRKEFV